MRRNSLAAALSAAMISGAAASPAITTRSTCMRAEPTSRAKIVQSIPRDAQIDMQRCEGSWCYAAWRDLFGFVAATSIAPLPAPPPPTYAAPIYDYGPYGYGAPYYAGAGYGWGYYGGHRGYRRFR
ncbi:hypothetical+protein [Methylocapsa aurea]|uniref:hypothetical protein n=1 Tax=Methylocapsa aurea TaxID=663610 RepID=UPI003D18EBA5